MSLVGLALVAIVAVNLGAWVSEAQAQQPAVVTNVVDGDTVDAQLADGRQIRVRLIGIDTPEAGECGTDQATASMEQLVLGRNVTLVSDPTQDALDRFGRSLFYIDRDDGRDMGLEMIRAGWSDAYVYDENFQRINDAAVALAMAAEVVESAEPPRQSVYATRGLLVA